MCLLEEVVKSLEGSAAPGKIWEDAVVRNVVTIDQFYEAWEKKLPGTQECWDRMQSLLEAKTTSQSEKNGAAPPQSKWGGKDPHLTSKANQPNAR